MNFNKKTWIVMLACTLGMSQFTFAQTGFESLSKEGGRGTVIKNGKPSKGKNIKPMVQTPSIDDVLDEKNQKLIEMYLNVQREEQSKWQASMEKNKKLVEQFARIVQLIDQNYVDEIKADELKQRLFNGMIEGLDPHSKFLDAEEFKTMQEDMKNVYYGIGVSLDTTTIPNKVSINEVFENGPADKALIKSGDFLMGIDRVEFPANKLSDLISKVKGPEGTAVQVLIARPKKQGDKVITCNQVDIMDSQLVKETADECVMDVKVVRGSIQNKSVIAKSFDYQNKKVLYIKIRSFAYDTIQELSDVLISENKDKKADLIVLDVKNNPGGLLNSALGVMSFFVDLKENQLLSSKGKTGNVVYYNRAEYYLGSDEKFPKDPVLLAHKKLGTKFLVSVPLAVLQGATSASASEIIAGGLKDFNRATVFGHQSFGKGSVQSVFPLSSTEAIKLTISRYYTPKDLSIQNEGVKPDICLDVNDNELKNMVFEDSLKNHLTNLQTEIENNSLTDEQKKNLKDISELKPWEYRVKKINECVKTQGLAAPKMEYKESGLGRLRVLEKKIAEPEIVFIIEQMNKKHQINSLTNNVEDVAKETK